ncbi:SCF E3 ubiquitin ligase complex F-box protein grrA-like [Aphidius gifuensis]|uniref:SCF E3 ubiquitin ligase complex F-box protein grrA-like n=1 Tax=Aphidius gifuensis TaxID=684658 RepID=UPI001CDBBF62|nr:SCF E3 ubiquitin ligase complex F-box protein grrA-like [Aphidius gifuensis]
MINSLSEEIDEIHLIFPHFRSNPKNNIFFTLKKFKRLQSLTLIGCNVDNIFREISEKTTLVYLDIKLFELYQSLFMFKQLVNLEHLNITVEHDIVEENFDTNVLINIFSTCKKLKYLDLPFGLYDVTKIPIKHWKNLENLEHLSIYNAMTDKLQTTITKYCKNLIYLHSNLEPGENIGKLTELKNLECLILLSSVQPSGDSIIAISNNCKKLKRLDISSSTFIGSIYGKPLSSPSVFNELSKLQYLEHLELSRIQNLRDNSIIAIAKNCKNLNYLGIGICPFITETGLDALTSLKNLHELNVSQLYITDNFIIKLKGFKKLYCAGCCKLFDTGIIQLIKNNPDLEHLDISWAFGCTTDLVIRADQETKKRTNGIILYIKICRPDLIEAFKLMNKSQWLVIE